MILAFQMSSQEENSVIGGCQDENDKQAIVGSLFTTFLWKELYFIISFLKPTLRDIVKRN